MRPSRLFKSSFFRLTLLYTAVFVVSIAVAFALIYGTTVRAIDNETNSAIEAELRSLEDDYARLGLASLIEILNTRSMDPADPDAVYLLADAKLKPLAGNILEWPLESVPDGKWLRFRVQSIQGGVDTTHHIRALVAPIGGDGHLLVGRDIQDSLRVERVVTRALAWALALAIGLGLSGGVWMTRRVLGRVERIAETSREINQGALSRRMPVGDSGDEFDRLSESLNVMLDRIEQLMTGMRLVTDSIAHDLRGPLTRLKSRIELTLRNPADTEADRGALTTVLAEADRVLAVFNALVAVAQAESGASRGSMESLSLRPVVEDAVELFEPLAEEKGISLVSNLAEAGPIRGHRQLLSQLVVNLLDNAVKYVPQGGEIRVAVRGDDRLVTLEVADNGPGVPAAERGRALERFGRIGSNETPGYGLGLSLVAAVARLHEAALELGDSGLVGPGGRGDGRSGLMVTLRFPRGAAGAVRTH
ncbi:MAG: HAMP domain-containing sensor histidine kinase [Alphaproteobacteria bacterium]